jgi:hypothetical protein
MKNSIVVFVFTLITLSSQAQTETGRVSFTLHNPSLRNVMIDFKSYSYETKKSSGYGYGLNALGSHAVNLPAPVRIYVERNGKKEILCLVKATDNGKSFSVNKKYEISREDWLEIKYAELNEKTEALEKAEVEKSVEQIANEKGIKLVRFVVRGSSWFGSMAHVRYQLPWETKKSSTGFSTSLSRFTKRQMTLPVGTKVYQCSDKFWSSEIKYTEKLIVTVDEEKENYVFAL